MAGIGIFEATYKGDVYVVDAITNNPGAAGGALTTRKGELLGLIGKELRNELTNTWINYAIPINARITVTQADGKRRPSAFSTSWRRKRNTSRIDAPARKNEGRASTRAFSSWPIRWNERLPTSRTWCPVRPADKAKLQPDDLIVYVDGLPVGDIRTFQEVLAVIIPTRPIKLEIRCERKLQTVTLKLEKPKTKKKWIQNRACSASEGGPMHLAALRALFGKS